MSENQFSQTDGGNQQVVSTGSGGAFGGDQVHGGKTVINITIQLPAVGSVSLQELLSLLLSNPNAIPQFGFSPEIAQQLHAMPQQGFSQQQLLGEISRLFDGAQKQEGKDYLRDEEKLWHYLDRKRLREAFIDLMRGNPPSNNLRILLFPDDEKALSDEIPDMLRRWWVEAETRNKSSNIRREVLKFESTEADSSETHWLSGLYKGLGPCHEAFVKVDWKDCSVEHFNQLLRNSSLGKESLFFFQRITGDCTHATHLQEYVAWLRKTCWPTPSTLVLLLDQYDKDLYQAAQACFHCDPERHYQKVTRTLLKDFYDDCKKYDGRHRFIEEKQELDFKDAVEQLKLVG
jgi:hypothetical protein